VIVFGLNQPQNLRIMATTFRRGDPSYAGALSGVALGLDCYHILELKDEIPADVWDEELAFVELELGEEERAGILEAMEEARVAA
jgi:hypothetical protein